MVATVREPTAFELRNYCSCTAIPDGPVRYPGNHAPDCPFPWELNRQATDSLIQQIRNTEETARKVRTGYLEPCQADELRDAAAALLRTIASLRARTAPATCQACGIQLDRQRTTKRYCGNTCRQAADRERRRS